MAFAPARERNRVIAIQRYVSYDYLPASVSNVNAQVLSHYGNTPFTADYNAEYGVGGIRIVDKNRGFLGKGSASEGESKSIGGLPEEIKGDGNHNVWGFGYFVAGSDSNRQIAKGLFMSIYDEQALSDFSAQANVAAKDLSASEISSRKPLKMAMRKSAFVERPRVAQRASKRTLP